MTQIALAACDGSVVGHAQIDEIDRDRVLAFGTWRFHRGTGYAKYGSTYLHRFIVGLIPGDGLEVDHVNGDKLDNRRSNLRVCSHRENLQNRHKAWGSSSHRGVYWNNGERRWVAKVMVDGRSHTVGRFQSEQEAARAAADFRALHMPFSGEMRDPEFVESEEKEAVPA